jgi:hypothetical protein
MSMYHLQGGYSLFFSPFQLPYLAIRVKGGAPPWQHSGYIYQTRTVTELPSCVGLLRSPYSKSTSQVHYFHSYLSRRPFTANTSPSLFQGCPSASSLRASSLPSCAKTSPLCLVTVPRQFWKQFLVKLPRWHILLRRCSQVTNLLKTISSLFENIRSSCFIILDRGISQRR